MERPDWFKPAKLVQRNRLTGMAVPTAAWHADIEHRAQALPLLQALQARGIQLTPVHSPALE